MTIGQRIAELRRRNNLSQEALGEALGVTRQSISKWESDSALPEIEKLVAMSRLFGVSVGALLGVEDPGAEEKASGADDSGADGTLTEAQLRMVEEIVARYTAALREETLRQEQAGKEAAQEAAQKAAMPPEKKKKVILACALCAGVLLFGVISLFSRLERLDNNYRNLSQSINNVSMNVDRQISGIAWQVENILNEQNALTADFGVSVLRVNAKERTVTLSAFAVPKTYEAGMTVEFIAECAGETVRMEGQEDNVRFSAELTCPLTNDRIAVSAAFMRGGVRETQVLDELDYIYNAVMPVIDVSSFHEWNDAKAGEPFDLAGMSAFVHYWEGEKEYTIIPEQPRFTSIRVGLFVNRKLVVWAEPGDTPAVVAVNGQTGQANTVPAVEEGSAYYEFPEYTLTLQAGDRVCIAAVAEDQFGNEYVFHDTVDVLPENSGGETPWETEAICVSGDSPVDTEGWEY